jgi:hypothetical protein
MAFNIDSSVEGSDSLLYLFTRGYAFAVQP